MKHKQCNCKKSGHITGKIEYLDRPERKEDLPPEKLLKMVPIRKNDNILDLGSGTGYLTIPVAEMVDGLVYALDIDPKMLEIINTKALEKSITNIRSVQGSILDIPLPNNSIDIVLASLVLHEVKPLAATLQQIKHVLKEDGYFICVELEQKVNSTDGPPRIHSLTMEEEIKNAGLTIIQKYFPTASLYILIAQK